MSDSTLLSQGPSASSTSVDAYDTYEASLLSRIPSVHSMRDIPFVGDASDSRDHSLVEPSLPAQSSGAGSSNTSQAPPAPSMPIPSSSAGSGSATAKTKRSSLHEYGSRLAMRPNSSLVSELSSVSLTAAMVRSFSTSSMVSASAAAPDSSLHSVRNLSRKLSQASGLESQRGQAASPFSPYVSIDEVHRLNNLRKSLTKDISQLGPTSLNAIMLEAVFERFNASFSDAMPALSQLENADISSFLTSFHQLRDICHQMQRIGPIGDVFSQASKLSDLLKWDYRQLINSFLTLLRTSPGFVVTAYLELGPRQARLFIGKPGNCVEDVMSAQRNCPLGIIFHGLFRDRTERIKYFAAFCSQALQETGEEDLLLAVLRKFTQHQFYLSSAPVRKLSRLLRRVISQSIRSRPHGSQSPLPTFSSDEGEAWDKHCTDLANILLCPELACPEMGQFVATIRANAPDLTDKVHALALKHYADTVRWLVLHPQGCGVLQDVYVGDSVRKHILGPMMDYFERLLLDSKLPKLEDALLGRSLQVGDLDKFFVPGQRMVLSLSEIVSMFTSLFPTSSVVAAIPTSSKSTLFMRTEKHYPEETVASANDEEDENEWCLENIRSDLEPVMKDLASHLPHLRARPLRAQQPGLFAEHWQVFKIEEDGLVNNLDGSSWESSVDDFDSIADSLAPDGKDVYTTLNDAVIDAEQRGDFTSALQLNQVLAMPSPGALQFVHQTLESSTVALMAHTEELRNIFEGHVRSIQEQRDQIHLMVSRLNDARMHYWYEVEVRPSTLWQKAHEVVTWLRGESALGRANSGSSLSSISRRFSTRNRRLSILSSHSVTDSFYVSKEYLPKPKLADREVENTLKYFKHSRVHNFCVCEELIHRFNAEIYTLLHRVLERDFLTSATTAFKKDVRKEASSPSSTIHRMSMSVLPDMRSQNRNQRKSTSSLIDMFERKPAETVLEPAWQSKAAQPTNYLPDRDMLCGILLSDLGCEFLATGSETDEYMQQTGRMVLDGDGHLLQACLDDISLESSPDKKLHGFTQLVSLVTLHLKYKTGITPSRAEISQELAKQLGREPGTLYRDLQIVAGLASTQLLENTDVSQAFWDVAGVAENVLDSVVTKSMDLAMRMLRYQAETGASTKAVANMAVSDSVTIWSFCARHGRAVAQRKLAQLYLGFPHTILEVAPFAKAAVVFECIDVAQARNAVVGHWMQLAADSGDREAKAYCQRQQAGFI